MLIAAINFFHALLEFFPKMFLMDTSLPAPLPEKRKRVGEAKGGRKKIPDADKRVKRIVLRFTEEEYVELKAQAKQSGRRLAVIVRSQFQDLVKQQQPWTPEQFRLCRELAGQNTALLKLAKQAGQLGIADVEASATNAAKHTNDLLDSVIA